MRILTFCIFVGTFVSMVMAHRGRHHTPPFAHPKLCCPIPDLITAEIEEKCMHPLRPTPHQELELLNKLQAVDMASDNEEEARNSMESSAESSREERTEPSFPQPPPKAPDHHPHHSRRRRPHHFQACFTTCVLNETGIMSDDNNVNETKLHQYLSVVLKDAPDVVPVIEQSFKTCTIKLAEHKARWLQHKKHHFPLYPLHGRRGRSHRHAECHPEKDFLVACVLKEAFNSCPTSIWIDSNECNSWRELARNWEPPHHHWGRRGHHHRRFKAQLCTEDNIENADNTNNEGDTDNADNTNNDNANNMDIQFNIDVRNNFDNADNVKPAV